MALHSPPNGYAAENDFEDVSMAVVYTCLACKDIYREPRVLKCGHSYCLTCVEKGFAGGVTYACPDCGVITRLSRTMSAADLPKNIQLVRGAEMWRDIKEREVTKAASVNKMAVTIDHMKMESSLDENGPQLVIDEGDVDDEEAGCPHVKGLQKSPLSCNHCGQKFCEPCDIGHKERMKLEMLDLTREDVAEKGDQVSKFLLYQESSAQERLLSVCVRLEKTVKNSIQQAIKPLINEIGTAVDLRQTKFRRLVDDTIAHSQEISAIISKLKNESVLNFSCGEMAEMFEKLNDYTAHVNQLRRVEEEFRDTFMVLHGSLNAQNGIIKQLSSLDTSCIQWKSSQGIKNELENELLPRLHKAAIEGDLIALKTVFSFGYEDWPAEIRKYLVNHRDRFDHGHTMLHQAAASSFLDVVRFLVDDLKADPYLADDSGLLPLHAAAEQGNFLLFQFLVNASKDVFAQNEGSCLKTFLLRVLGNQNRDFLRYLLDFDETIPTRVRCYNGGSLFHVASNFGHLEAIRLMFERGFPVDTADNDGNTPLHLAHLYGFGNVVQFLLSVKPELAKIKNKDGKTISDIPMSYSE